MDSDPVTDLTSSKSLNKRIANYTMSIVWNYIDLNSTADKVN